MSNLHLHRRRDALFGLVAAVAASVAILGGLVTLYASAGHTPWVAPDGMLAEAALQCREARAADARHRCLRELAQAHARSASQAVAARAPQHPPEP